MAQRTAAQHRLVASEFLARSSMLALVGWKVLEFCLHSL